MSKKVELVSAQLFGRPARVTVSATHVVAVCVRGEPHPDRTRVRLPIDDGQVGALLAWLAAERIYPVAGVTSGPGVFVADFTPEDAERVVEWCQQRGLALVAREHQP